MSSPAVPGPAGAEALAVVTPSAVRASRRAYRGAPPVIPHPPQRADCVVCHTATGMQVPNLGAAPANPHLFSHIAAAATNCRQCHLFQLTTEVLSANTFVGLPATIQHGDRLTPTSPPVIPHVTFLRDNCIACHAGPVARPEIRCRHPERTNCRQCHVEGGRISPPPQLVSDRVP